jgi:hypothetical protein
LKGKVLSPFKSFSQKDKAPIKKLQDKMPNDMRDQAHSKFEKMEDEETFQHLLFLMKRLHQLANDDATPPDSGDELVEKPKPMVQASTGRIIK